MPEKLTNSAIKHPFEVRAAQAVEDIKAMEEGFFTPDIYFTNGPKGALAALHLRGYIVRMGYQAEIAVDMVPMRGVYCFHLKVGKIPEHFLEDIKDFMSIEEIRLKRARYCVHMEKNGKSRPTDDTAMMRAFKKLEQQQGGGRNKPRPGMK